MSFQYIGRREWVGFLGKIGGNSYEKLFSVLRSGGFPSYYNNWNETKVLGTSVSGGVPASVQRHFVMAAAGVHRANPKLHLSEPWNNVGTHQRFWIIRNNFCIRRNRQHWTNPKMHRSERHGAVSEFPYSLWIRRVVSDSDEHSIWIRQKQFLNPTK